MTTYAVFGLGMMGKAIVYDILQHDLESTVIGYEYDQSRIAQVVDDFTTYGDRFQAQQLILTLDTDLQNELEGVDVAIGAIDYKYNLLLTRNCIISGVHFLDLGGNPEVVDSQHALSGQAEEANVTVIPDCGLAPGMVNVLAAGIMDRFQKLDECHIRVGGLPQHPQGILKYQQVFSIRGLTNEYIEDAIVIRDGEIQAVKSLTEIEELSFPAPYDQLEAFQTAGGTSSLPKLYEGKIGNLTYKTIRYKGHVQFFRFLQEYELLSDLEEGGFSHSPRQLIEYYLEKHLPKNGPDVVLIRISVAGILNGESLVEKWDCIDNPQTYSAMARTTAFPISIIAQFIAHGIITERGVIPGESCVPFEQFKEQLDKRGIMFETSTFST